MLSPAERQNVAARCDQAAARMRALDARFPGEPSFASILAQLAHVAATLRAGQSPTAAGKSLNFGFLGMKFVRDFDSDLSRELAEINELIDVNFGAS